MTSTPASPTTAELLFRFDELQRHIAANERTLTLLDYDNQAVAPFAAAAEAAVSQGYLSAAQHELLASDDTAALLDALQEHASELDDLHRAELAHLSRTVSDERRLPADLVSNYRRVVAEAFPVWRAAKEASDFAAFSPYLERVVASLREQAACLDPDRDPYDVLLDRWQHGLNQQACDQFFDAVRATTVPLIHQIAEKERVEGPRDYAFRHAMVPAAVQERLAWDVAHTVGLDTDRLTFGLTIHPCTFDLGTNDVRIAHHYTPTDLLDTVGSMSHESGHALYMQNVDPIYAGTCLHGGVEAGIHESQSRLIENNVFRSRAFTPVLLGLLRTHVPEVYGDVSAEDLYRAHNIVRPGAIRTMADELTYPLHIMVRYTCEKAMISGDLAVADVPATWRDLMRDMLGVEIASDAEGCLQDMHWASDYVGYFPSYALGNAYAAQFMHHARAAYNGDFDAAISSGDLTPVTGWLHERVWRHGKLYEPDALINQACAEPFNPAYYTHYLQEKYTALYNL